MVRMTEEDLDGRGSRGDLSTLSTAVAATRRRIDAVVARTRTHIDALAASAGPLTPAASPSTADGTVAPPAPLDRDLLRRAAWYAADNLTGDRAEFTGECTSWLADLGRDLRKYGVTTGHYGVAVEAVGRAVCDELDYPWPGADLTYRQAEQLGLPDGLTELLQAVDLAVRIVALGAVDDEDSGVPAAVSAEVLEVVPRTARVTVVRLQADNPRTGWPGQSLDVRTPARPDEWQQMASALPPNDDGYLEFHCTVDGDGTGAALPQVGERWVVANPTGGLGIPDSSGPSDVLMIAVNGGLAALRALVLDVAGRENRPQVRLYWQTESSRDLHDKQGLQNFDRAFPWLTTDVVVLDEDRRTAAEAAVSDGAAAAAGLVLVSADTPAAARRQLDVLTAAGVDPDTVIAEP